jgi:hypothetical protein
MSISFRCTKCGKSYRLDDKLSGRRAKCACGWLMVIPKQEVTGSNSADVLSNASPPKYIEHTPSTPGHNSASALNQTEGASNSQEIKSKGTPIDINYREPMPWYLIVVISIIIMSVICLIGCFVLGLVAAHKTVDEGIKQKLTYGFSYHNYSVGYVAFSLSLVLISIVISVLVILGFLTRSRLARQYLRVGIMVGLVGFGFTFLVTLFLEPDNPGGYLGLFFIIALILLLLRAIDAKRSLRFFGLYCPRCGSYKVRAADFLHQKIRCKDCAVVTEPWNG